MSDENLKPTIDSSKSEEYKPAEVRRAQVRQGKERVAKGAQKTNQNPIVTDETYGGLREDNRVVMRHQIALNLENFRAAPEAFTPRPARTYPPLSTMTTPFCSIIIPNFNGKKFLSPLLAALQRQSFQDFEVILADDASTDGSVAQIEVEHPNVRLLVNRQNQGFAKTCNAAVDAALGRVVVLLNNDTEPEPTWLAELVKAVCKHPESAIFASKMLLFNERNKLHTTGDFIGANGIPRNRGVWELDLGQYDQTIEIFSGSGGGSAFRKDVWRTLGGFDEDFWMYLEDVDYGFRAQLMGWRAVFVPTARLYHHLSATGGGVLASYYVGRNTLWAIAKNMPRHMLLCNMHKIIAGQLKIAWDALRHSRGDAARARLRGQIAGILGLPRQLQKRRVIQRRRQVESADLARWLV